MQQAVKKTRLENIPTNIITGFLGVGKTTSILHLLANKPDGERWAILVNEFGEVGIDGGLLTGKSSREQGVFVREVPGGCMCCAAGLPMQMALNMLLARAKPDRLIIEPTGLGHPEEVMAVLQGEYYQEALDLQATITLVDARKLSDSRYTGNDTFNQQLGIADIIVANKSDLYAEGDFQVLENYLASQPHMVEVPHYQVKDGEINLQWLQHPRRATPAHHHHDHGHSITQPVTPEIPECGYLRIDNKGSGFQSSGWIFAPRFLFDHQKLNSLLLCVDAERLKGVFLTDQGITGFNMSDDVLTSTSLDNSLDSRIELITAKNLDVRQFEQQLRDCILPH